MRGYLLDTHILIWLLSKSNKLNKNIREDIEYFQHIYYASVESLREIVILQSLHKITFSSKLNQIVTDIKEHQIIILPVELTHIKTLEQLPVPEIYGEEHQDPFDRMLIAQAIAEKFTMISADGKFPLYKEHGLKLLENNI